MMLVVVPNPIRFSITVGGALPRLRLWRCWCRIQKGGLVRVGCYDGDFIRVPRGQVRVDEDEDVGKRSGKR